MRLDDRRGRLVDAHDRERAVEQHAAQHEVVDRVLVHGALGLLPLLRGVEPQRALEVRVAACAASAVSAAPKGTAPSQRAHHVDPAAHAARLREARAQAVADVERREIVARLGRYAAGLDLHDLARRHQLQATRIVVHELLPVDRLHGLPVGVVVGLLRHHVGIADRAPGDGAA